MARVLAKPLTGLAMAFAVSSFLQMQPSQAARATIASEEYGHVEQALGNVSSECPKYTKVTDFLPPCNMIKCKCDWQNIGWSDVKQTVCEVDKQVDGCYTGTDADFKELCNKAGCTFYQIVSASFDDCSPSYSCDAWLKRLQREAEPITRGIAEKATSDARAAAIRNQHQKWLEGGPERDRTRAEMEAVQQRIVDRDARQTDTDLKLEQMKRDTELRREAREQKRDARKARLEAIKAA